MSKEEEFGKLKKVGFLRIVNLFLRTFFKARFILMLSFFVGIVSGVFIIKDNPKILGIRKDESGESSSKDVDKLIEEVGRVILLPEGETPTVATVTDVEKVKDQAFFAKAQNGDKILIYSGAKKAYLYRPSEKRIIEVGLVNIGQQGQEGLDQESKTLTPTLTPSITPTRIFTPTLSPAPTSTSTPTPIPEQ